LGLPASAAQFAPEAPTRHSHGASLLTEAPLSTSSRPDARMWRRRKFDDELDDGFHVRNAHVAAVASDSTTDLTDDEDDGEDIVWSSYTDALHGPSPLPAWVITDASAI